MVSAIVRPRSLVDAAGLILIALAGAAAHRLEPRLALPLWAISVGLGLSRGGMETGDPVGLRRRMEVAGIGATAALAGAVVQRAMVETGALSAAFGPGLSAMIAGALSGTMTGLGAIGRLISRASEAAPIDDELRSVATEVSSNNAEVGELLRRASDAHHQAVEIIGGLSGAEAPAAKAAADDLIVRMVRFGRQWLEIERRASGMSPEQLTERRVLLEARLEKTDDPVTKAELGRAVGAVRSQAEALAEILRGRERAVARLEHQVATLERLRLAALRHRSADASRIQSELQPVVEELAEAGGDYDLASEALRDADRETTVIESTALVPSTSEPN